jgi:hypothetical protein
MSDSGTSQSTRLAWPAAIVLLISAAAVVSALWGVSVHDPVGVVVLTALALLAFFTDDLSLPAFRIDIGLVLAVAALVLTGPVGAVLVLGIPELIRPLVERYPVRRIATVVNLASIASLALVGRAALLALPTAHSTFAGRWLGYTIVATVMAIANCSVILGILSGLVDHVLLSDWRTQLRGVAATVAFAPFAGLTAALLPTFGLLALIVVALASALPGVLVHLVTWTPSAGGLTVPEARLRYATALASHMALSRSQRRVLLAAARTGTGRTSVVISRAGERDSVAKTLLLAGLWPGRDDCFSRLQPAEMGIESRVLLVAHGWAELTAQGTERLEHRLALLTLHNNPRRYDRRIVATARDLVPAAASETKAARIPCTHALPRRIAQLKAAAGQSARVAA